MSPGEKILLVIGVVQLILLLIAAIAIGLNKKFSTIGKVFRAIEICICPVVGPILVLIEVLLIKEKKS